MDSPWQPLIDGRTSVDPARGILLARMWLLPHRVEHPPFLVESFSDPRVILAHAGARLDLPDHLLHVDFGPVSGYLLRTQTWTVWRDDPWPDLDTLIAGRPRHDLDDDFPGPTSMSHRPLQHA